MKLQIIAALQILVCLVFWTAEAKESKECEVCIKVLKKLEKSLTDDEKKKPEKVEAKLRKMCAKAKTKENRFCYYIGGTEDAATGMLNSVSKPMGYHKPVEKICQDLNKKDHQICQLQYEEKIDLKNTNLKKLRVKQLKKILSDFDEQCTGCVEKSDFIKKIQEVMKEHTEL